MRQEMTWTATSTMANTSTPGFESHIGGHEGVKRTGTVAYARPCVKGAVPVQIVRRGLPGGLCRCYAAFGAAGMRKLHCGETGAKRWGARD